MKILYAVQATGNGHISRAIEIIPHLQQYGQVDVFMSGTQTSLYLPFEVCYKKYGLSFCAGKKGGIDWFSTFKKIKPLQLLLDIWKCRLHQYDLIINDFEPVTAWSCKMRRLPCIAMSHQAAFMSDKTPRPSKIEKAPEWLMRNYAPGSKSIGFHFNKYDNFIYTPVIRSEIRKASIQNNGHIAVYLPAYHPAMLVQLFKNVPAVLWKVFTKNLPRPVTEDNVKLCPIDNAHWVEAVATSEAVLMGAGFEGPAEALYLGKKLMVIPMNNQYEQQCNAEALALMGVRTYKKIGKNFSAKLNHWLLNDQPVSVNYQDDTATLIGELVTT